MRIAFVNPPRISRKRAVEAEDCCWGAGPLVLPSLLLNCATEAETSGHEVAFVDLAIDPLGVLTEWTPDLVVHALAWQWWQEVNRAMGEACRGTSRLVLAVPPGYSMRYLLDDKHVPFAVAYSEPEAVVASLPLEEGDLMTWRDNAPGIAWRDRIGILRRSDPLPNCMGRLGLTDWSLVPDHYWPHYRAVVYQVSRGCPYRCKFCVWGGSTITDRTFRMKPPEHVALDLRVLQVQRALHTGKPLPLYLLAAQLTSDAGWLTTFHHKMAPNPCLFQSNVNLADVTPENLGLLKEVGLVSCAAGLDGASDGVLRLMGKPYDMAQAVQGLVAMQNAGLLKRTRVRYGMGEGPGDVMEAIGWLDHMREAGIRRMRVAFAPIVHYEGTRAYREAAYDLAELPGRDVPCLVQADPPDWSPYVDKLHELRWLGRVGARK